MKELTDALGHLDARTILEVGCGGGRFLRRLIAAQPRAERIVGVDVVDPRTTVENDLLGHPGIEWVTAAGHELPAGIGSFDLVCIAHVLHHLEPRLVDATLAGMKRVLRPEGTFLICEMYRDQQTDAQMSHVRYHHWIAEIDRLMGVPHYETFSRVELLRIVGALELSQVEMEDFIEEKPDPMEPEELARILNKIESRLEAARSLPEYDRLVESARGICNWIHAHGIARPTRLVVTGRKEG